MPLCQVYHMDIIPDAGAVRRGIIVAEYPQAGQLAYCHLGNVGYQIVGDAVGILPDEPLGCAPMGLKYRSATTLHSGSATTRSRRNCSIITLV